MNVSIANNTNYINHKSQTKKQNNHSKGSFEDYLKHSEHQNKKQDIPTPIEYGELTLFSPQFMGDKSKAICVMELFASLPPRELTEAFGSVANARRICV